MQTYTNDSPAKQDRQMTRNSEVWDNLRLDVLAHHAARHTRPRSDANLRQVPAGDPDQPGYAGPVA